MTTRPYSVTEKARLGYYNATERGRQFNEEQRRLEALFRTEIEAECGTAGHPKASRIFELAWDYGRSYGYEEVAQCYRELAELVKP